MAIIEYEPGELITHSKSNLMAIKKGTYEEANSSGELGTIWYVTDAHTHMFRRQTGFSAPDGPTLEDFPPNRVGTIEIFAGPEDKIPGGWIICDGRAVSRTSYKVLFDLIGTSFGEGNGVDTFNIPDMTTDNRFVYDDDVTEIGENEVQLTVDQIPQHAHNITATGATPNHQQPSGYGNSWTDARYANRDVETSSTGGDEAHENRPPFMKMYYIIKV